ncbi:alpha/beta hydrolase [Vibrio salinus]|uniref:alpha/beta hydrolase n=1 Tax=Vibrio salinus TaxID=2899784 RepID=UPI001E5DF94C|nr:hypothetical protein [Vibrio salinus]MCE0495474.1 hypothetical protein [Vibrio salinus]
MLKKEKINVGHIPALLWGEKSDRIWIAVHGNQSDKADDVIGILAEEAMIAGYQVLSFDLPKHGERKTDPTLCKVQNCVKELDDIISYAKLLSSHVSVFACSMGAYFSLLSYKNELALNQALFLSPVVNMESILLNLMKWFDIREKQLMDMQEIALPIGETLYWDYYCYVKSHPVVEWNIPTSVLYGSNDNLTDSQTISSFSNQFNCDLEVLKGGEHYFHTREQLQFFRQWLRDKLLTF